MAGRTKNGGCRRACAGRPRFNAATARAMQDAKRIMAEIVSGKRKAKTLEEMLSEIAAV